MFDGRFVGNNSSYRAYRFPWIGTPTTLPSVTATTSGASDQRVRELERRHPGGLVAGARRRERRRAQAVATATKQGFETQVTIAAQPYVEVQALDSAGRALATSSVVHAG